MTELCDLAFKYQTDKCPQIKHHFTEFYHELFKDRRNEIKKVVEIGIGSNYPGYLIGPSLYMWRDYFPNAHIYGADILPELLFTDECIDTFLCDQTKKEDLERLIEQTGSDIDIFIDDGSHHYKDQMFTCLNVMPMIDKGVTYIIEDLYFKWVPKVLGAYKCQLYRPTRKGRFYFDDRMLVVKYD